MTYTEFYTVFKAITLNQKIGLTWLLHDNDIVIKGCKLPMVALIRQDGDRILLSVFKYKGSVGQSITYPIPNTAEGIYSLPKKLREIWVDLNPNYTYIGQGLEDGIGSVTKIYKDLNSGLQQLNLLD